MEMRGGDGYAEGGQCKEAVWSELVSTFSSPPAPSWPSSQAVSPLLVEKANSFSELVHTLQMSAGG